MRFPLISVRDRGLQYKFTLVLLILFACTLGSVFLPYFWGRENLKQELEKSFLDLSNAIRVSVEQMTSPASTEEETLRGYVEALKKRTGIREVSIVGEDMGIIDSTDPRRIGKTSRLSKYPKEKLIINATFGEPEAPGEGKIQSRDLVVPVRVGGDNLGFIHIRMQIDDFTEVIQRNLYLRFFSTLIIFSLGLILAVSISSHYVRPIEELAHAAEKVAAGDLSQALPVYGKDEVGRLTKSFNEMIARLRQNRELEERVRESQYLSQLGHLSSGVAHEIRNPLNFIGLAIDHLDALTEGRTPEATAEKSQVIGRIKEEVARLNELVTNFILYGKPPVLQRTRVRIPEIVESILRVAMERMRSQGIACRREFRDGPEAMVDPDMLRRAVMNLVGNAVDAMPKGGELRASAGWRDDGAYEIAVEDTGIGIPEGDREKVFEPYFTTKSGGLGLGLVLTRKIVAAHGGEILVESDAGRGTRIRIVLPPAPAS